MARKKSWQEKLRDSKDLPRVAEIPAKMEQKWGPGTLVIPAPMEVNDIMKSVPAGKLITINQIRARLANRHHTTIACPMTTGIFAWIAAHAAEEEQLEGKSEQTTPYWRTLKSDGVLNEKYPGGIDKQKAFLEREGHTVVQKGKKFVVQDYEQALLSED